MVQNALALMSLVNCHIVALAKTVIIYKVCNEMYS